MHEFFVSTYVYIPCVAHGTVPLELELQIVVSHLIGAGDQTPDPWKGSQCFLPLSHHSSPK